MNLISFLRQFWYVGIEHGNSKVRMSTLADGFSVYGETTELGKFHMRFKTVSGLKLMYSAATCDENVELHRLTDYVKSRLKPVRHGRSMLPGLETSRSPCSDKSNVVVMQVRNYWNVLEFSSFAKLLSRDD